MSTFQQWVSAPRTLIILIVCALLILFGAACAGINFSDFIRVKTPTYIQETEGVRPTMPLSQATARYDAWVEDVQRTGAEWRTSIEQGYEVHSFLSGIVMQAWGTYSPLVSSVPGAPFLLPAATLLIGYMTRRSGDVPGTQVAKEKIDSYNKGAKDKEQAILTGAASVGGSLTLADLNRFASLQVKYPASNQPTATPEA